MLEVHGLNSGYGDIQILYDVSFYVKEGEIVALIGSNGAGKTTILNAIYNLIKIYSGKVTFKGIQLNRVKSHDMIVLGITYIPEGRHLFGGMTVRENLELGAYRWNDKEERANNLKKVFSIFPKLEHRQKQLAGTLSGGEQQMLALGRGLMSRPKLLLLDEPSQGLAPLIVGELFRVLERVNSEGITVLLVEQNVTRALTISERAYVLENGRIVIEGRAKDLLKNEDVRKTYLGM